MKPTIAVIGLGYVGLPLAIRFASQGCLTYGIDIDHEKVHQLMAGKSYLNHVPSHSIFKLIENKNLICSSDFSLIQKADAVLICVPTPLSINREPDLSFVVETASAIVPHLKKECLVSLESTTYPGTTEEILLPILQEGSRLLAGKDFYLAFSPEREDPGNDENTLSKIPKVIGGLTAKCREKAVEIYSLAIDNLVLVSSCKAAEATKLMENIFRSVNIALVNELKVVYDRMGIDIWEVIEAAKSKPFGFMPFYPGPGLGGHCIPIDPFYLTWKAREFGLQTRFIELAGEVNTAMPDYVFSRVVDALNGIGKAVSGSRILLLGLAYKAEVDDERESPSYVLWDCLEKRGAKVDYFDPYVHRVPKKRRFAHLTGIPSIEWIPENLRSYDLALICTAHRQVDYSVLAECISLIVDTRNAMKKIDVCPANVIKA